MLYAVYECEHCKNRIAIKTTENEIRKTKHFRNISKSLAVKIQWCEYCKLPEFFNYVGYWHSLQEDGIIYTPTKPARIIRDY